MLTPLAFDPAHPFPHISNLSLNLAVVVHDPVQGERFARVKVPDTFPRLVPIVDGTLAAAPNVSEIARGQFVWLEDLVASNLDMLFPGLNVTASYAFRITRDADLDVKDIEASDLLNNIEEMERWVLSWGTHATVIRPIALAERIQKTVAELQQRYQKQAERDSAGKAGSASA